MDGKILSTLELPEISGASECTPAVEDIDVFPCLLCDQTFAQDAKRDDVLKHFLLDHKLVVSDANLISDFKRYIRYWKDRFLHQPISDFCFLMKTNSLPTDEGSSELYYFLSDDLPEDKNIRNLLKKDELCRIIEHQQKERQDVNFSHVCLFCREKLTGNRSVILQHMANDHSFNLGHPDNIVFIGEFLDKLHEVMDALQCFYCEKTFKDKQSLKEHMRKKQHRCLNPKNKTYDKYYIINYLEPGKNWEDLQNEDDICLDRLKADNDEKEWSDWMDESCDNCVCLYCSYSSMELDAVLKHMKEEHGFDFKFIRKNLNLTFYQQVKLVNFIRRQLHLNSCYYCEFSASSKVVLVEHLKESGHINLIPDANIWNQFLYYFPTYENDNFLCHLEDDSDLAVDVETPVLPEDYPPVKSHEIFLKLAKS